MDNFVFWQRWLLVASLLVILFGLFMVFFNATQLHDVLIDNHYEPVFWKNGNMPDNAILFQQWVYGAWGSTIAGWGIIIAFVTAYPFRRREKWAWTGLVIMLSVWYVLDISISIYYRVFVNVALNSVFFILILLPLLATKKKFVPHTGRNTEH